MATPSTTVRLSLPALVLFFGACAGDPSKEPQTGAAELKRIQSLGLKGLHAPALGIAAAGQPSPEQMSALKAAGYEPIVCLRASDEKGTGWEESYAAERGIRFVRIPVRGVEDLSRANATRLAAALPGTGPEHPAIVVCRTGHRAGALTALMEIWLDGVKPQTALAPARAAGMSEVVAAVDKVLAAEGTDGDGKAREKR